MGISKRFNKRDSGYSPPILPRAEILPNGSFPAEGKGHKNLSTHKGEKLTPIQERFICEYIVTGDAAEAYRIAYGSKGGNKDKCNAYNIMRNTKIVDEILYRMKQYSNQRIADGEEILAYFTSVMRGEVKDQFGLDTTVSDRTRAAVELAKRTIDIDINKKNEENHVQVTLTCDNSILNLDTVPLKELKAPLKAEFEDVENETIKDGD